MIKFNMKNIVLGLFVFAALSFAGAIFSAENVSAAGGIGDGGDSVSPPTGNGASTTYGWGWYKYDLDAGEKPARYRDGKHPSGVPSACESTSHLFAFIIMDKKNGSPQKNGVVYVFKESVYFNPTLREYKGNADGKAEDDGWQTRREAEKAFEQTKKVLGDAAKGFEFGENVAWFCWNESQKWNTKGSASVNMSTANLGDKVVWTHEVRTTKGSEVNTDKDIKSWTLRSDGTKVSEDTTSQGVKPDKRVRQFTSSFTVQQNHIGNTYCRVTIWSPRSWNSDKQRKSSDACVEVKYSYTMKPYTQISQDASTPGSVIKFNYSVENQGPTKTDDKNITYTSRIRRVSNSQSVYPTVEQVGNGTALKTGYLSEVVPAGTMPGFVINRAGADNQGAYTIQQDDVNNWICSRISISRTSQTDSDNVYDIACRFIPYNYTLTPRAPSELPESGEAGSTIPNVRGDVYNNGPTKSKDNTIWQLTGFVLRGARAHNGGDSATAPCGTNGLYNGQYYNSGSASNCRSLARGNGSISSSGVANLNANNVVIPNDLEVGDSYCFAVSVRDRSHSPGSTPWRHSAARCIVVSKRPKVNVLGGDLWVRGERVADSNVSTSVTRNSDGTFGSFVEYALAARGSVQGMSSASGLEGRRAVSVNVLCGVSYLTFGNSDGSSCQPNISMGGYNRLPSVSPNIAGLFDSGSALNYSGANLNGKNGVYRVQGQSINIAASTIERGRSVVVLAPQANVNIRGDIEYTDDELRSVGDIPQVVIIAKNIFINSSVSRVDAWLVATGDAPDGYINTCGGGKSLGSGLNAETCDETLVVNGPVIAKSLLMRRTAGAGSLSSAGEPAEIFNLRPDAYLWLANRISSGAGLPTTSTTELPPKY